MSANRLLRAFHSLRCAAPNAAETLNRAVPTHAPIRVALRMGKLATDLRSRGSQEWLRLLGWQQF